MEESALNENTLSVITKRQNEVDNLPLPIKELVWEYGWGIVSAYVRNGITAATVIRHLIETTLRGAHEIRTSRFETRAISLAGEDMNKALNEFSMPGNGQALVESLRRRGVVLFPMKPTESMIQVSMDLLQTEKYRHRVVSKYEKHRARLKAAMEVAAEDQLQIIGKTNSP